MKHTTLKSFTLLLSLLAALLLLSSCGDDTTTPPAEDKTSDVTSETSDTSSDGVTSQVDEKTTVTVNLNYPDGTVKTVTMDQTYNPDAFQVNDLRCNFLGWQLADGNGTAVTITDLLSHHANQTVDLYPILEPDKEMAVDNYGMQDGVAIFSYQFLQQEEATIFSDLATSGSYCLMQDSFRILDDPSYCQIKTLILKGKVSIGAYALAGTSIEKVVLPDSAEMISPLAFVGSSVKTVENMPENSEVDIILPGLVQDEHYCREGETALPAELLKLPSNLLTKEYLLEGTVLYLPSKTEYTGNTGVISPTDSIGTLSSVFWKTTVADYVAAYGSEPTHIRKIIVPKGITVPDGAFDGFDGEIVYES